jgi:hypothetical protein
LVLAIRVVGTKAADPLSAQVEIETCMWDVLPDHLKTGNIVDHVVKELKWVKKRSF